MGPYCHHFTNAETRTSREEVICHGFPRAGFHETLPLQPSSKCLTSARQCQQELKEHPSTPFLRSSSGQVPGQEGSYSAVSASSRSYFLPRDRSPGLPVPLPNALSSCWTAGYPSTGRNPREAISESKCLHSILCLHFFLIIQPAGAGTPITSQGNTGILAFKGDESTLGPLTSIRDSLQ